ncbi:MAG: hypothetical protein A3B92_03385 [Candidatus Harrisonbacteria bacterium RIFCSPHIGHO2_02_FULL_42_16]|uniref:Uncharacterized protein n=1 Tax=Candidatus Harrisonbacteria bacterium RIFCSPHIGHO2_02_FULL_42_16 TaxID=1798404 RepID=A0A1G1ZHB7_9BACT|nr:MAG: hypothetical protein A3B92_03385 [Candidatus Harrisonbacteria bacterium RIFCSPHIGHO2_02_FULL_42_16]
MKQSLIKILVFALLLIFYGSLLAHKIQLPAADDLPRQMKIGEEILAGNLGIFYKNTFSFSEPDQVFYNHHWLSGAVFYLVHQVAGWNGLIIFKIAVLLSAFSLIFLTAIKKADFWLVAFFSLPAILILSGRTGLRPEIFSYLFIAVFLYLLIDFEKHPERNRIFWLIPMQLLWVNTHVFFSIGIMIVGGFLAEKIILNYKNFKSDFSVKKLASLLLFLIAVSFLNPRGAGGIFYFYLGAGFPGKIIENQSLLSFLRADNISENIPIISFFLMVILIGISFIFNFRKNSIFYFLASIFTAALGFAIIRGTALFGLIFLPAISANLNDIFSKIRGWLIALDSKSARFYGNAAVFCLIVLLFILIFPGWQALFNHKEQGIGLAPYSENSAQFFKEQNLKGPILNNAGIGSYLIYYLYPEERVFYDNRFADAYSASFARDTYLKLLENEEEWRKNLKKYGFNSLFFYYYDESPYVRYFLWRRIQDPDWSLVYADTFAMILIKNIPENQEVIERFGITRDNALDKLRHLAESSNVEEAITAGDIFNLIGRSDLTMKQFLKVTARWPERGRVWLIMGQMALDNESFGGALSAVKFLEKAIAEGQKTAEAYSFLGRAYAGLDQPEKAKKALRKSLKINPDRQDARELFDSLEKIKL